MFGYQIIMKIIKNRIQNPLTVIYRSYSHFAQQTHIVLKKFDLFMKQCVLLCQKLLSFLLQYKNSIKLVVEYYERREYISFEPHKCFKSKYFLLLLFTNLILLDSSNSSNSTQLNLNFFVNHYVVGTYQIRLNVYTHQIVQCKRKLRILLSKLTL